MVDCVEVSEKMSGENCCKLEEKVIDVGRDSNEINNRGIWINTA